MVEPAAKFGRKPQLDFNGPNSPSARKFKQQIDLGAAARSVEAGGRSGRRRSQQVFNDKALPAGAGDRVAGKGVVAVDAEQRMNKAAAWRPKALATACSAWRGIILANLNYFFRKARLMAAMRLTFVWRWCKTHR